MVHYKMRANVYDKVDDREKLFIERVEAIISKENIEWVSTMRKNKEISPRGGT